MTIILLKKRLVYMKYIRKKYKQEIPSGRQKSAKKGCERYLMFGQDH